MPVEEGRDLILAFGAFERTSRIDQRPARLQPAHRAVEKLGLKRPHFVDLSRFDPVQHVGMAPENARGRTRRIEQDRIDRCIGRPCANIALDDIGRQTGARKIF
mgnify:CR=1 FL=1